MSENGTPDVELLATYGRGLGEGRGGEAAFAALVARHGGMVYHACLRVLNNPTLAEEAAQAVFVVLARKAGSVRGSVGGFLHGVAVNVAKQAVAAERLRREREQEAAMEAEREREAAMTTVDWAAVRPHLDAALAGLPEMQRAAAVLCFLEGRRQQEAAAALGISRTAVENHLRRAQEKLRKLLSSKVKGLTAIVLSGFLAERSAEAACPPFLAAASGQLALAGMSGGGAAAGAAALSSNVNLLAKGAMEMMFWAKVKTWAAVAAAVAVVVGGVGLAMAAGGGGTDAPPPPAPAATLLPPIEKVEIVNQVQGFKVNGQPFFPIMSWAQKPTTEHFKMLRNLGINTFCGDQKGAAVQCQVAKEAGGYAVAHWKEGDAVVDPYLFAWLHGDEPDMPKKGDGGAVAPKRSVQEVVDQYGKIKAADKSRPVFVTFTANFMKQNQSEYNEARQQELYNGYAKGADITGFDIYPIYGLGRPSRLNWPAYGTEQLCAIAGAQRPVYAWIETSKGSRWITYEKQPDVLPVHTRFEVWGCIIRGATAIGYFTHAWRPRSTEFAPTAEMQNELKRLNGQITKLAPAILASPTKAQMMMGDGLPCHLKATETATDIWLFAQVLDLGPDGENKGQFQPVSPRGGKATFQVPGLKAGASIEVVDENRTLKAGKAGEFSDDFAPLSEHIYRIAK